MGKAEERFFRYVESLEKELENKPAFQDYRREVSEYLVRHSDSIAAYSPEQLISEASSFEELLALRGFLRDKFGNEQGWWSYYHEKRRELATAPSYYGKGKFGVPVNPQVFHRHWGKGQQSAIIQRDLLPQQLSYTQITGREPLWHAKEGRIPKGFSQPLSFKPSRADKYFSFDIETTGLLHQLRSPKTGSQRGLYSIGWVSEEGTGEWFQRQLAPRAKGKWAGQPGTRPFYGYEVEEIVSKGQKVAASLPMEVQEVAGEKELLAGFLKSLKKQPKDRVLLGFNIEKFDIPFLKAIAYRHGREKELEAALKGRKVVDVAEETKGFLSQQLSGKYLGWQRSMFEDMGLSPKGWTLESIAHALGYQAKEGAVAHTPKTDASMAAFVHETLSDERKAKKIWRAGGEQRYLKFLAERGTTLTPLSAIEDMTEVRAGGVYMKPQAALSPETYETPLLSRLSAKYGARDPSPLPVPVAEPASPKTFAVSPRVKKAARIGAKGLKYLGATALLGAALPGQGTSNFFGAGASIASWKLVAKQKGNIATRALAAGVSYAAVKGLAPGSFDSMSKGGMSEAIRHYQTDFGSPWQGPKVSGPLSISLMAGAGLALGTGAAILAFSSVEGEEPPKQEKVHGQYIDPEIMEFRKKWIKAPGKRRELERIKDEAYEPMQPGDLEDWRLKDKRGKLARVDLSGLTPVWEDVDTLLLEQPWYKPWKRDIGIRLTGIDAPEIEHPDDPVPWTRRKQSQPFGKESVEKLKELIGDEKLEVYVASDPDQRTYKRYLGAIFREGSEVPLNVEAVQRGLAAALPWGESGTDIIPREQLIREEQEAAFARRGMWKEEFWQRYLDLSVGAGRRVTFTSFSDLSRLAANLHLAAAEELMSRDDIEYQPWMGRYIGGKLNVNYSGSASSGTRNKIDALHYGSTNSMGALSMKAHSDFGSGVVKGALKRTGSWFKSMWERVRGIKKKGGTLTEKGAILKGERAFAEMKRRGLFSKKAQERELAYADTILASQEELADTVIDKPPGRETVDLKNPNWMFPEIPTPKHGVFDPYTRGKLANHIYAGPLPKIRDGVSGENFSVTREFSLAEKENVFLQAAKKRGLEFSETPDLSGESFATKIRSMLNEAEKPPGRETVDLKNPGWVFPEVPVPKQGEFDQYTKNNLSKHLHAAPLPKIRDGVSAGDSFVTREFSLAEKEEVFLRAAKKKGLEFSVMPNLKEGSLPARVRDVLDVGKKPPGRETVQLKNPAWMFPEVPAPKHGEFDPYTKNNLSKHVYAGPLPKIRDGVSDENFSVTREFSLAEKEEVFLRAAEKKGLKFSAMPDLGEGSFAARIRELLTEFKGDFESRWEKFKHLASGLFRKDESSAVLRGGVGKASRTDFDLAWQAGSTGVERERLAEQAGSLVDERLSLLERQKEKGFVPRGVDRGRAAAKLREQEEKIPSVAVPHVSAKEASRRHKWSANKGFL